MSTDEVLSSYSGRLATFDGQQQLPKRRASSTKKKTPNTAEWPHENPKPEDLAKAGFYYRPSATELDNVACWICHKNLNGWEAGDIPALEHLNHVPDCGWAVNVCLELRRDDMDQQEEDPLSDKMIDARRATFLDLWPHEKKKGWKCKTDKMVAAGWSYNATTPGDDYVTCYYCGLSLDGWEPKDDPMSEHKSRAPDCHFFSLKAEHAKLRKTSRKGRGRTSQSSRASNVTIDLDTSLASIADVALPADTELDKEDAAEDEGDTVLTTASKPTRGRKTATKPKTTKRSTKGGRTKKPSTIDESQLGVAADGDAETGVDVSTLSSTSHNPIEKPASKRKGGRANAKPKDVIVTLDSSVIEENAVEPKATKRATRKTKKDESQLHIDDSQMSVDNSKLGSDQSTEPTARGVPKRGKKRLSNGEEKLDSSIVILDTVPAAAEKKPKAAPKRARQTKKAAAKLETETAETAPTQHDLEFAETEAAHEEEMQQAEDAVHEDIPTNHVEPQVTRQLTPPPEPQSSPFSAQSSDAENQPPSIRISAGKKAGQEILRDTTNTSRTPMAMSPSKRNIINGGLASSEPWTAVDLEKALMASPAAKRQELLDRALGQLTEAEKRMTVEEWILMNARNAEQKLRDECERMISKFESEGVRALRTLEGLESR